MDRGTAPRSAVDHWGPLGLVVAWAAQGRPTQEPKGACAAWSVSLCRLLGPMRAQVAQGAPDAGIEGRPWGAPDVI